MERLTKKAKMNLAIQVKKRNPKLSFNKLYSIYNVPVFTLKDRYNNIRARTDITLNLRKLTLTEKDLIID